MTKNSVPWHTRWDANLNTLSSHFTAQQQTAKELSFSGREKQVAAGSTSQVPQLTCSQSNKAFPGIESTKLRFIQ